jgi:O-glycosyl hydrolase
MRAGRASCLALIGCLAWFGTVHRVVNAQEAVMLPASPTISLPTAEQFSFVSDGPIGPGWSRPDEIARVYFHDDLPALFQRTILLSQSVPMHGKLSWIFTGPHAGFTVELTPTKVRLVQRYYDSFALYRGQGNYPEETIHDKEQQYVGDARTVTVILDSHLNVEVRLNGIAVVKQACLIDITRHQLMFSAPRTEHLTLAGALLSSPVTDASVQVNSNDRHQTMLGFGGSPSIPAYGALSDEGKKQYWELVKRYNLLIDREYPMGTELKPELSNFDAIKDATPHYYGDNFPNGEVSDFEYSQRALELGGDVIYEMWALPRWATEAYTADGKPIADAWGKYVKTAAKPEEYARIVVGFCRAMKQRTGSAPAIVGIQNEVEQPPEVFNAMAVTLRSELDKAGFQSVKIHMADASYLYLGVERAKAMQKDPAAWRVIDYTAAHEYDYQEFFANTDMYDTRMFAMHDASDGKPFLATEICINDPHYQELSYRIALNVGQLYQKNLTELDAEALLYCWLLLDVEQPSFGGSRSLLVPDRMRGNLPVASSFELRVLGAYSRHVLKGMTRVESRSSNPDLLTAAFEDSKRTSLIVLNRSTTAQRLNVEWAGKHWTQIERTSQTLDNAASTAVPTELVVQPGEILTISNFVVD